MGPAAKPKTYTETQKDASSELVLPNSTISCGTPGANIATRISSRQVDAQAGVTYTKPMV